MDLEFRANENLGSEVGTCGCLFKPIEIKYLPNDVDLSQKPYKPMTTPYTSTRRSAKCADQFRRDPQYALAAKATARFHALMARKQYALSTADCEDLEQDMVVLALVLEPKFDRSRASARTFTEIICRQSIGELVKGIRRHEMHFLPFDHRAAANDDGAMLGGTQCSCYEDDAALIALSLDWERASQSLPKELLELATLLVTHRSVSAAKRALGLRRGSFYRRLDALKMHMRMFGIRVA